MSNNNSIWFFTDKDNIEWACSEKPAKTKDGYDVKLNSMLCIINSPLSIQAITGRTLTWESEPLEWKPGESENDDNHYPPRKIIESIIGCLLRVKHGIQNNEIDKEAVFYLRISLKKLNSIAPMCEEKQESWYHLYDDLMDKHIKLKYQYKEVLAAVSKNGFSITPNYELKQIKP